MERRARDAARDVRIDVTVIVPVEGRTDSLAELHEETAKSLEALGLTLEFLFVASPRFHPLTQPLEALAAGGAPIRILSAGLGAGETALLRIGMVEARGRIVVTLPAFRQVEPAVLPALVRSVERGADLAVARRFPRVDAPANRFQSRLLHRLLGPVSREGIEDVACGVRAMRAGLLDELPLRGEFLRFLPLVAQRGGYVVEQVKAPVHARAMGPRLQTPGVYLGRIVDVVGLLFLLQFMDRPLRFFGPAGLAVAGVGAILLGAAFLSWLFGFGASIGVMILGAVLFLLGAQALGLGLIGELFVQRVPRARP